MQLSETGNRIIKMKYSVDRKEPWEAICLRVSSYIAEVEKSFGKTEEEINDLTAKFYQMIYNLYFVPGGRILANSGTGIKNLMNCIVLPIVDSRRSIYETLGDAAELFAMGCGIGYNFSHVREEGAPIKTTGGQASGPLSFLTLFDQTGEVIQQASRRGAQMAMMNCLSGETLISTLVGKKKIKDLVGTHPYVYCTNGKNIFVRQAESVFSNGIKPIIRVWFDNDDYLDCTEDHRILLYDGNYLEAGKLKFKDQVKVFHKKLEGNYFNIGVTGSKDLSTEDYKKHYDNVFSNQYAELTNHEVIKIEELQEEEVFDISVPEFHNFVANDVFVHNCDHPDIEKFIDFKSVPNSRNKRLLEEYHNNLKYVNGTLKNTKYYDVLQKTLLDDQLTHFNVSVVLDDNFMKSVLENSDYELKSVINEPSRMVNAKNLLLKMAKQAHVSGDPGLFFSDRVNEDNMVPYIGELECTNPCISGDTYISVADGRGRVKIKDLEKDGKDVDVFTEKDGKLVIRTMRHIRKTGKNSPIYKVSFSNGSYIKATANHKFILTDNSEKETLNLLLNDSLIAMSNYSYKKLGLPIKSIYDAKASLKTDLPIVIEDGKKYVVRICEVCGNEFKIPFCEREHATCSRLCSVRLAIKLGKRSAFSKTLKGINEVKQDKVRNNQVKLYNDLLLILGRHPNKKEWISFTNNKGISTEVGRISSPFTPWKEPQDTALSTNHQVVSVEFYGYEDVYTGTVDDTHTFFSIGSKRKSTKKEYREMGYVLSRQCGEVPEFPYESCDLGSINLYAFYDPITNSLDWESLEDIVRLSIRFLDNVQEISFTPLDKVNEMSKGLRRLGLGVMGWADLLAEMGLAYDSPDAFGLSEYISWFISFFSWQESIKMAEERGSFKFYDVEKVNLHVVEKILNNKRYNPYEFDMDEIRKTGLRNVSVTSIAPTGCYDDKTELLTKDGWKLFKDLKDSDPVLTYNIKDRSYEYQSPTQKQSFDYTGKMFHFSHRSTDLLVTPNHRMVIRNSPSNNVSFKVKEAKNLSYPFVIPQTASWSGNNPEKFTLAYEKLEGSHSKRIKECAPVDIDINNYLKFMGYYLSEGSSGSKNRVFITQIKAASRKIMFDDLRKLPFKVSYDGPNLRVTSRQLVSYLKQFGHSKEKFVPQFIKDLSPDLIEVFLNAYILGDGYVRCGVKANKREIYTVSPKMADDLQELFIKVGSRASVSSTVRSYKFPHGAEGTTTIYCVRELIRDTTWIRQRNTSLEDYSGKVYCVSVPNTTVVVRRNGFTSICGNSIALVAGVNSAIEPFFALAYRRYVTEGVGNLAKETIVEINPILFRKLRESGMSDTEIEEVKQYVLKHGSVQGLVKVPEKIRNSFKTSHDLKWEDHLKMQACWQESVTNAVSKTVNMVESATVDNVYDCYMKAWDWDVKGLTVYRDKSRSFQILNVGSGS